MKVRILAVVAGEPYGGGETVELPDDRAAQLIAEGRAEQVGVKAAVSELSQRRNKSA